MPRRLSLLATLVLTACAGTPTGTEGRWLGQVTPQAGACDVASQALLIVQRGRAMFAPNNGTLVLHGTADAAGHIVADLATTGMNHTPYVLAFQGTLAAGTITGTYTTPRCRALVTLKRG